MAQTASSVLLSHASSKRQIAYAIPRNVRNKAHWLIWRTKSLCEPLLSHADGESISVFASCLLTLSPSRAYRARTQTQTHSKPAVSAARREKQISSPMFCSKHTISENVCSMTPRHPSGGQAELSPLGSLAIPGFSRGPDPGSMPTPRWTPPRNLSSYSLPHDSISPLRHAWT